MLLSDEDDADALPLHAIEGAKSSDAELVVPVERRSPETKAVLRWYGRIILAELRFQGFPERGALVCAKTLKLPPRVWRERDRPFHRLPNVVSIATASNEAGTPSGISKLCRPTLGR